ncbi:response regulator [Solibacillus silvestris]|uniref:response regulator n=1 Tax=Solibacillus silvestris TaxID=76853 RepID=UPI003F7EDFC0
MDIWLIEDDFRIAAIHADYIKAIQPEAQVQQFLSGASLKEALLHTATPPTVLFMDLFIPDVTGYELVAYVRAHFPGICIIMVTAAAERAHVEALFSYGVFDYIVKPFDEARLQKAFQQLHLTRSALQKKTHFTQQDLDSLFYRQNNSAPEKALPKGIDTFTLERVIHLFNEQMYTTLTAAQLSEIIGTSRSTARRYLEYLVEMNILETKLLYGTVGRPERNYVLCETYEQN